MLQAPMLDGLSLDPFSLFDDGFGPAEVGVGWRHIVQALVVAPVVVVFDERRDLGLKVAGQEVVLQQDAVLQGLVPTLDLALGLGMERSAAHVAHALGFDIFRQFAGDVTRPIAPTEGMREAAETAVRAAIRCRRAALEAAMASQGFSKM